MMQHKLLAPATIMHPGYVVLIIVAALFIAVFLVFGILSCCLDRCFVVVRQEKGAVTERFGKMNAIFTPGVNCKLPCVDQFKEFKWSRPVAAKDEESVGRLLGADRMLERTDFSFKFIDMREDAYALPKMRVYTKDAIPVDVTVFLIYNFSDVKRCFYEVDNLSVAIYNTVQAQITELFAEYYLEECMSCYKRLNALAIERYTATFASWGVKLHSMQILEIIPNEGMKISLTKQILSELQRRAKLIEADATQECMKLASEGQTVVLANQGVGAQQRIKNISEGEGEAAKIITQADADALYQLKDYLAKEGIDYADYQMADRYIDTVFATGGKREISIGIFKPEFEGAIQSGFKGGAVQTRNELD